MVGFIQESNFLNIESQSALLICINKKNWLNYKINQKYIIKLSKEWLKVFNIKAKKQNKFKLKMPFLTEKDEILYSDAKRTFATKKYRQILTVLLYNAKKKFGDYQQNLSYFSGFLLLFFDIGTAFKILTILNNDIKYFINYWKSENIQANVDGWILFDILKNYLPNLSSFFKKNVIQPNIISVSQKWFGGCFIQNIPFPYLITIFDQLFRNGIKTLFRFSLSILKIIENKLLNQSLNKIQLICRVLTKQNGNKDNKNILSKCVQNFFNDKELDIILKFDLLSARHSSYKTHLQTQLINANSQELLI